MSAGKCDRRHWPEDEDVTDLVIEEMERIHARAQRAADLVEGHVTPVFAYDENDNPDLEGSGILGRLDDKYYLVTAAHVLKACDDGVGIPVGSDIQPLKGASLLVGYGPTPGTSSDPVDIGFLRLDAAVAAALGEDRFLNLSRNAAPPMKTEATLFIAIGYPVRDLLVDSRSGAYSAEPTVLYTGAAERRGYEWAKVDYQTHFLIRFRKQDILTDRSIGAPPEFRGISGGGVWPFDIRREAGPDNPPCFGGLIVERPPRYARSILVTRGSLIERLIRHFAVRFD